MSSAGPTALCSAGAVRAMTRRSFGLHLGINLATGALPDAVVPDDTVLPGDAPAGWRLDVARHLPAKRRAIAAHASQHGGLVTDDPTGFRLPPAFLSMFDQPFETYVRAT